MTVTPLPRGARVLHIGPFKTGSTAVQWAFHNARDALEEQGVRYLSRTRHDALAARHPLDLLLPTHVPERAERAWRRVVTGLRADDHDRAVYSSEYLCLADDAQIDRVVSDVGPESTYVVVTVRPLAALLPSQYQQLLQGGLTMRYPRWVDGTLNAPPERAPTASFWRRHRHDELVMRWGRAVGLDHVVVVVLDSRDFDWTARVFEGLLHLRQRTLSFDGVPTNRSLTWPEAEVLRHFNQQFEEAEVSARLHRSLVGQAVRYLKLRAPEPQEQAILTERWAVERANALGREMAAELRGSGARVHGDLDQLGSVALPQAEPVEPTLIETATAARFGVGLTLAAEQLTDRRGTARRGRTGDQGAGERG